MRVRLIQVDGVLPNIALMKLSHYHRAQGHEVVFTRSVNRDVLDGRFDLVYASTIFDFSAARVARVRHNWPGAVISGTGIDPKTGGITVEEIIGAPRWGYENYDYSIYPDFKDSIGFTQRGCRLKCAFCGVHTKEGPPISLNAIEQVWRGPGHPKKLHLLDNDFLGQPDWRDRIAEIRAGKFRICMSQGINIRLIDEEGAAAFSTLKYSDTKFNRRRFYTAWDNIGQEAVFFRGIDILERGGIPPKKVMAYMLVGFDPAETWPRIWHRFYKMTDRKIKPYPMVFNRQRRDLLAFQRWVNIGLYRTVPWTKYERSTKTAASLEGAR